LCPLTAFVQHRFYRSAAFAPQSAAVPAERAVLEALLPKLRKVFFKNLNLKNQVCFVIFYFINDVFI